jgi:hypothetical protein
MDRQAKDKPTKNQTLKSPLKIGKKNEMKKSN